MAGTNEDPPSRAPEPELGIVRSLTDDGWYVLPVSSGVSPKPFFDVAFNGHPNQSYAAAVEHNKALRPYKVPVRNYKKNRSDKGWPDLPVGITLAVHTSLNRGGRGTQTIYSFKVTRLKRKTTTVYIGTVNTWEGNFERALEKAIEIRERSRKALLK